VSHTLVAFTPAIVGSMLLIVTSRVFYAIDYFRGILWSQLVVLAVYVPLAFALREPHRGPGLAAAFGIAELLGGLVSVALAARLLHARWADARPLGALIRPSLLVIAAVFVVRIAIDHAHLSDVTNSYAGALIGGAATVLAVSGFLLTSDWPEARVFRRYAPGSRNARKG
jgi:peptidoglycan biosynthesis protein MviN/MurJ (putative lipid II flippase)